MINFTSASKPGPMWSTDWSLQHSTKCVFSFGSSQRHFFVFGLNGIAPVLYSLSIFFNKATPFLNAALLRAIKKGYKMQEQAVINGLEEARLGREGTLFFCRPFFFSPLWCTLYVKTHCVWFSGIQQQAHSKQIATIFFFFFYHVLPLATHLRKFTLMLILVL